MFKKCENNLCSLQKIKFSPDSIECPRDVFRERTSDRLATARIKWECTKTGNFVQVFYLCLTGLYIWEHTSFYVTKKKKITTAWWFPPPPHHHLIHEKYFRNTGPATIALNGTLSATILHLGSVRFVLFYVKSHHFYHTNFDTRPPSWPEAAPLGI